MTRRQHVALAAGLMALVILIGLLRMAGQLLPIDELGMRLVTRAHGLPGAGLLTALAIALHWLGEPGGRLFVALALGMFLARAGRSDEIVWLIALVVGVMLLNLALKLAFAAERPIVLYEVPPFLTGFSFPSGHASGAMALWGGIALLTRRRIAWIACTILILAMGTSRIWLGAHYPSDVAAGWLEGAAWLLLLLPVHPTRDALPGAKRRSRRKRAGRQNGSRERPVDAPI